MPPANKDAQEEKKQAEEQTAKAVESMEKATRKRPPTITEQAKQDSNGWPTSCRR